MLRGTRQDYYWRNVGSTNARANGAKPLTSDSRSTVKDGDISAVEIKSHDHNFWYFDLSALWITIDNTYMVKI